MGSEEQIVKQWKEEDDRYMESIFKQIRARSWRIQENLVNFTASLCGVDAEKMMTDTTDIDYVHAKWLFWYAYKYMTGEPYIAISKMSEEFGKKYTEQSIAYAVKKMGWLVEQRNVWKERWAVLKRIISLRTGEQVLPDKVKITVKCPKGVEVIVKHEQ